MRTISIAIPSYNRYQQTIDSFAQVLNDERIIHIVISDDKSTDGSFEKLVEYFKDELKVEIIQTSINLDCYLNKCKAAQSAIGSWVIIFDSDNILTPEYLDAIYAIPEWDRKTIYQPSFAKPHFDFRKWSGLTLTKENVSQYVDTHLMTALNAFNLFINRYEYLKVWDGSVNPGSSDSLYFSYCWLKSGNSIFITPNLEYEHYISENNDGHYQTNSHLYVEFHENLMQKIKQLK